MIKRLQKKKTDDKHHGYRPIINASVQLTFKRRKNHPKNQMRLIEKN